MIRSYTALETKLLNIDGSPMSIVAGVSYNLEDYIAAKFSSYFTETTTWETKLEDVEVTVEPVEETITLTNVNGKIKINCDIDIDGYSAGFTAKINARPDDYIANVNSSKSIEVVSQPNTLITNIDAYGSVEVAGTPQIFVAAVQAEGDVTVTGTPTEGVLNSQSTGTITVSAEPQPPVGDASAYGEITISGYLPNLGETFRVGAQTFTWVAAGTDPGNVVLGELLADCVANIVTSITRDSTDVTAVDASPIVEITAVDAGTKGNALIFTENCTGMAMDPATGFLAGGTDTSSEQIVIGAETYTFRPAKLFDFDIVISATPVTQATNIITAITADSTLVTAEIDDISNQVVNLTAIDAGTAGDQVFSETATGIVVTGLDNGVDEVHQDTLTVGDQEFNFVAARSGVGSYEITINANNTTQATNIKDALNADIPLIVSADSTDGVVTVTAVAIGTLGTGIILTDDATGIATPGWLTGGGDEVAADTLTVATGTWTFVTARGGANQITVSANPTTQATNIKDAVNSDSILVTAEDETNTTTFTSVAHGTTGNTYPLSTTSAILTVSGETLENGRAAVAADTLILDDGGFDPKTYTFVASGAGGGEINLGASTTLTAGNIALATMPFTLTADSSGTTVTFTATVSGTGGDDILITAIAPRITGTGVTAGGVDEVKSYQTINGFDYIFCAFGGDVPVGASEVAVMSYTDAEMEEIADAYAEAMITETTTFSENSVVVVGDTVTANYFETGLDGNEATFVSHLDTEGDITITGISAGKFTGATAGLMPAGYEAEVNLIDEAGDTIETATYTNASAVEKGTPYNFEIILNRPFDFESLEIINTFPAAEDEGYFVKTFDISTETNTALANYKKLSGNDLWVVEIDPTLTPTQEV